MPLVLTWQQPDLTLKHILDQKTWNVLKIESVPHLVLLESSVGVSFWKLCTVSLRLGKSGDHFYAWGDDSGDKNDSLSSWRETQSADAFPQTLSPGA